MVRFGGRERLEGILLSPTACEDTLFRHVVNLEMRAFLHRNYRPFPALRASPPALAAQLRANTFRTEASGDPETAIRTALAQPAFARSQCRDTQGTSDPAHRVTGRRQWALLYASLSIDAED